MIRILYSVQRAPVAFYISGAYFLLHAGLAIPLARWFGAPGIAFATSASAICCGLAGWFVVREPLVRSAGRFSLVQACRLGGASLVGAIPAVFLFRVWGPLTGRVGTPLQSAWRLAVGTAILVGVFLVVIRLAIPTSFGLISGLATRVRHQLPAWPLWPAGPTDE
jgi:peptidoglycan biosynthesis protein MviN/MurJ (putative lipid II flippase)